MNDLKDTLVDMLIYIICVLMIYYVFRMIYPTRPSLRARRSEGCGGDPKGNRPDNAYFLKNLTAKDKACLAVGICETEEHLGEYVPREELGKWKAEIMRNADNIFKNPKKNNKKR